MIRDDTCRQRPDSEGQCVGSFGCETLKYVMPTSTIMRPFTLRLVPRQTQVH